MSPWDPAPNLPTDDPRVVRLRALGDKRRAGLLAAAEALDEIGPLAREVREAGEKKRVIAEMGCIGRPQLNKILARR